MQYVYVGMEYDPTLKSFLQSLLQTSGRTNCRAIFDTAGSEIFSIHECCLDNEAKRSTGKGKKSKKRSTLQTELKRSIYLDHHHLVLNGYKETVVHCARSYHRDAIKKRLSRTVNEAKLRPAIRDQAKPRQNNTSLRRNRTECSLDSSLAASSRLKPSSIESITCHDIIPSIRLQPHSGPSLDDHLLSFFSKGVRERNCLNFSLPSFL